MSRQCSGEDYPQLRGRLSPAPRKTIPCSEGLNVKRFKQSSPVEEVQIIPTMNSVDSPERALGAPLALEGEARGASWEACASLEGGLQPKSLPLTMRLKTRLFLQKKRVARLLKPNGLVSHFLKPRRTKPPDKLILGSYVKPLEWSRPSAEAPAPDLEAAWLFIRKCNPFDKRDSSIMHMRNLYPHNIRVSVVAHFEE